MTTTLRPVDQAASPLLAMTRTTPTALWCDSARPADLAEALAWGTVGSTCNPVLAHGLGVRDLPMHHRDPFDRMLISQARAEELTVVSADRSFAAYDVRLLPADE